MTKILTRRLRNDVQRIEHPCFVSQQSARLVIVGRKLRTNDRARICEQIKDSSRQEHGSGRRDQEAA